MVSTWLFSPPNLSNGKVSKCTGQKDMVKEDLLDGCP